MNFKNSRLTIKTLCESSNSKLLLSLRKSQNARRNRAVNGQGSRQLRLKNVCRKSEKNRHKVFSRVRRERQRLRGKKDLDPFGSLVEANRGAPRFWSRRNVVGRERNENQPRQIRKISEKRAGVAKSGLHGESEKRDRERERSLRNRPWTQPGSLISAVNVDPDKSTWAFVREKRAGRGVTRHLG